MRTSFNGQYGTDAILPPGRWLPLLLWRDAARAAYNQGVSTLASCVTVTHNDCAGTKPLSFLAEATNARFGKRVQN